VNRFSEKKVIIFYVHRGKTGKGIACHQIREYRIADAGWYGRSATGWLLHKSRHFKNLSFFYFYFALDISETLKTMPIWFFR